MTEEKAKRKIAMVRKWVAQVPSWWASAS
jgi:hypothetical protein